MARTINGGAELAIVLASLRLWQEGWRLEPEKTRWLTAIATDNGTIDQMDNAGIDALCERLNVGDAPVELSECCHAEIGYDAYVDSNNEVCGGPYDDCVCNNCGMHDPEVWDGESPPWPRDKREGQADLPEGVEEPPEEAPEPPKRTFTVLGLFDDTGQVFSQSVEATDPHEAMREVGVDEATKIPLHEHLQILCAIEGEHIPTTACEDSGKAAYAVDLQEGGDQ